MNFKHAGEFILKARKAAAVNQAQMANAIRMTPQFLGRCEKGEVALPLRFLPRFLELTGVSGEQFIKASLKDERARIEKAIYK